MTLKDVINKIVPKKSIFKKEGTSNEATKSEDVDKNALVKGTTKTDAKLKDVAVKEVAAKDVVVKEAVNTTNKDATKTDITNKTASSKDETNKDAAKVDDKIPTKIEVGKKDDLVKSGIKKKVTKKVTTKKSAPKKNAAEQSTIVSAVKKEVDDKPTVEDSTKSTSHNKDIAKKDVMNEEVVIEPIKTDSAETSSKDIATKDLASTVSAPLKSALKKTPSKNSLSAKEPTKKKISILNRIFKRAKLPSEKKNDSEETTLEIKKTEQTKETKGLEKHSKDCEKKETEQSLTKVINEQPDSEVECIKEEAASETVLPISIVIDPKQIESANKKKKSKIANNKNQTESPAIVSEPIEKLTKADSVDLQKAENAKAVNNIKVLEENPHLPPLNPDQSYPLQYRSPIESLAQLIYSLDMASQLSPLVHQCIVINTDILFELNGPVRDILNQVDKYSNTQFVIPYMVWNELSYYQSLGNEQQKELAESNIEFLNNLLNSKKDNLIVQSARDNDITMIPINNISDAILNCCTQLNYVLNGRKLILITKLIPPSIDTQLIKVIPSGSKLKDLLIPFVIEEEIEQMDENEKTTYQFYPTVWGAPKMLA